MIHTNDGQLDPKLTSIWRFGKIFKFFVIGFALIMLNLISAGPAWATAQTHLGVSGIERQSTYSKILRNGQKVWFTKFKAYLKNSSRSITYTNGTVTLNSVPPYAKIIDSTFNIPSVGPRQTVLSSNTFEVRVFAGKRTDFRTWLSNNNPWTYTATQVFPDIDKDGVDANADCDDGDPNNYPGNTEACDGQDNDCDNQVDEGCPVDNDGDGVKNDTDCNDSDANNFPGNAEACDGQDNDCDGQVDEGCPVDNDGDGATETTDCDDSDANNFPGNAEACDGQDNDCDGQVDEGVKITFYVDRDSDGFGVPTDTKEACNSPYGYADNNTDCNDSDQYIYPGRKERCDHIDNDCDGQVDEGMAMDTYYLDSDSDGFGDPNKTKVDCMESMGVNDVTLPPTGYDVDGTDCDDSDPEVSPIISETCDGKDNNCDGLVDEVCERAIRLVAGDKHTCAIMQSQKVMCWGSNQFGQLGNNTIDNSNVPVVTGNFDPNNRLSYLSAGENHTCSKQNDGTIMCWGSALSLVGDINAQNILTPIEIDTSILSIASDSTLIVPSLLFAGGSQTYITMLDLDTSETWAFSCGANDYAQLGLGYESDPVPCSSMEQIPNIMVGSGGAGRVHACAKSKDPNNLGYVICWGSQANGRLGNGMVADGIVTTPEYIQILERVNRLSVGNDHSCVEYSIENEIYCWGANSNGQLGDGNTTDQSVPIRVNGMSPTQSWDKIIFLSAGGNHTCAKRKYSDLHCWGSNTFGQLGNGTTDDSYSPVTVESSIKAIKFLAAGGTHTCVITDKDQVKCWGRNDEGQLGDGTNTSTSAPVLVTFPEL